MSSAAEPKHRPTFTFRVLGAQEWDEDDDNIDVEIELANGERFAASFFTLANLQALFDKNKRTGEFRKGTYLWSTDLIIVERLTQESMTTAIMDLVMRGQLVHACTKLDS